MNSPVPYLFKKSGSGLSEKVKTTPQKLMEDGPGIYRCHSCKHVITHKYEQITMQNSHTHHFTNPAGINYHIACFSHAEGCVETGPLVSEHTWFAGYRWQVTLCAGCHEHMGWLFRGEDFFYGLICNRLIEDTRLQ